MVSIVVVHEIRCQIQPAVEATIEVVVGDDVAQRLELLEAAFIGDNPVHRSSVVTNARSAGVFGPV
jgi:hypothetical protein